MYESPLFTVLYNNRLLHLCVDTGATASLAKLSTCLDLGIKIHPTSNRAVQVDGQALEIAGEIHVTVKREKLVFHYNALVVKNMATDFLAGTPFLKENDIYARLATDKIVVQGKYHFNSTSPLALTASIKMIKTELTPSFSFPILVKAFKTSTLLSGEGFEVPVQALNSTTVHIVPRREAPQGFIVNELQEVTNNHVFIKNTSNAPIKIKKNTPICSIEDTREAGSIKHVIQQLPAEEKRDLSKVKIDTGNLLSEEGKKKIKNILEENKRHLQNRPPGLQSLLREGRSIIRMGISCTPTDKQGQNAKLQCSRK